MTRRLTFYPVTGVNEDSGDKRICVIGIRAEDKGCGKYPVEKNGPCRSAERPVTGPEPREWEKAFFGELLLDFPFNEPVSHLASITAVDGSRGGAWHRDYRLPRGMAKL